ncbi:hypothetical protein RE428_40500 [Marinobacter nanhaiticus D15-8W]|uniref:Restriction endonuclease subunit S n=1 Tax=Marinobacter nanhaiticus D15-8W TaxID=626887 RepID=N6WWX5_9GAMM|nr:restriction endonuclease subunit S [Marinobacter nanhaiticus]ENO16111.1 restriction endonuclease subunit S [Marinobacter nanhaiticus D15-8W]BES73032.1 hypothetical protein RE428_40500 [Marinobacter nanhaiticus D15-8W]
MPDLDWSEQAIGDIFRINTAGILPNTFPKSLFYHHSLPAWDECGGPVVEPGAFIESNKTTLKVPCVLVSKLNPRKPRVSAVANIPEDQNHCASTEFVCLEPTKNSIHLSFWRHFFSHKQFANRLDRVAIGSTNSHKRYGPRELLSFRIDVPSLAEQAVITEVLDTLDTQIQKTETVIAKLEKIKEGLLHDLLTRGIDQNGELRPTPEQAPELYKESVLGLTPKEWDISTLGDSSISSVIGPFGSDLVASDYQSEGVPVVFVRDIAGAQYDRVSQVFVSPRKAQALSAHEVTADDLLLTKMGLPPCISAVYPKREPAGIITADIVRLRLKSDVAPEWAHHCVNSEAVKSQVRGITAGVTRPKVTLKDARSLRIAVPDIEEQARILSILQRSSSRLESESASLAKLRAQKSGLMDDLLTGRTRVASLLKGSV